MLIYPVFHVNLSTPVNLDVIINRPQVPPPRLKVTPEEEYTIKKVLNSRWIQNELEYLVRFAGQPVEEDSWEKGVALRRLEPNTDLIEEYHQRNPNAWGPDHRPPTRESCRRPT